MELSIKKINRSLESFINKDYQYTPTKYIFDYVSDPNYAYVIADYGHYMIRVPREDMPQILSAGHPVIKTDFRAEDYILNYMDNHKQVDYEFKEVVDVLKYKLSVAIFTDGNGHRVAVNTKFFKQFYNNNIVDKGVPKNVLFTGDGTYSCASYPLLMWQDDEVVGVFCPIKNREVERLYADKEGGTE